MTISTFSLGTLATNVYGLGPTDACLTALFFNLLTTLPVALFSCWGKSTGLRQMMIGRFSFGPYWIWFPIVLNCIACVGWVSFQYLLRKKDRQLTRFLLITVNDQHYRWCFRPSCCIRHSQTPRTRRNRYHRPCHSRCRPLRLQIRPRDRTILFHPSIHHLHHHARTSRSFHEGRILPCSSW